MPVPVLGHLYTSQSGPQIPGCLLPRHHNAESVVSSIVRSLGQELDEAGRRRNPQLLCGQLFRSRALELRVVLALAPTRQAANPLSSLDRHQAPSGKKLLQRLQARSRPLRSTRVRQKMGAPQCGHRTRTTKAGGSSSEARLSSFRETRSQNARSHHDSEKSPDKLMPPHFRATFTFSATTTRTHRGRTSDGRGLPRPRLGLPGLPAPPPSVRGLPEVPGRTACRPCP